MRATLAEELSAEEVRARFDWARRRGHPAWLWPEVTVEAWRAALLSVEAATRAVLAGSGAAVLRGEPEAIGIAAYTSGMGPLLGHWVETGEVEAGERAAAWLRLHLSHNRRRMRRLAGVAAEAVERLGAAGVTPRVIKGMHTAHAFFPDPATRPLSDVDLLVPPSQIEAAEGALRGWGFRPVLVQRGPYKCDWAPAGAARGPRSLSLTHAEDPFTLDTHASLDRNFFGVATVRLDRLLPHDTGGTWGHTPGARVLGQPLLVLLLATHASEGLHGLSLIRLVELALVIRRDVGSGALDWRELADAAEEVGAPRFAYPALRLCEMLAPGSVPAEAMARFAARATPQMQRVLARLTPGTAQRLDRLSLGERFMWAGTAAERARRLAYALWPAPAGGTLAGLGGIYAGRAWRVARGRVSR
jgi:hypothetical protein